MDKLELKHIAPYLPYGLKVLHTDWNAQLNMTATGSGNDDFSIEDVAEYAKPILRPLSVLTKEIEHNGEILVFSDVYLSNSKIEMLLDQSLCLFNNPLNSLDYNSINLLLKYHFDVFGLIDAGLAIDINTLNK